MAWDDILTSEQKDVVKYTGTHARLLAGPGTGKTFCLTKRVIYLITELGISPKDILVITFTRAALNELRKRISKELGDEYFMPRISTLHSFALSTILKNPLRSRLPQPLRIADDFEEDYLIHKELRDILNLKETSDVEDLFDQLSANWETLSPDWESRFPNPQFIGAWNSHRQVYGYSIRDELVYQLHQSQIDKSIKPDPIYHIMVDEYQDLNPCDLGVINNLIVPGVELYVAGDDDQSIYGFRYANPDGIRNFPNQYSPNAKLELTVCKRSDKNILELAAYVANQDPQRIEKKLVSSTPTNSGEVKLLFFPNFVDEAKGIAILCNNLIKNKGVKPVEILILVRTNRRKNFSKPLVEELQRLSLPVAELSDPMAIFNCPKDDITQKTKNDGRILLCYLRLLDNIEDSISWRVILDLDKENRIGKITFNKIYEYAMNEGITYYQALLSISSNDSTMPELRSKVKFAMEKVITTLNNFKDSPSTDLLSFLDEVVKLIIRCEVDREEVLNIFKRVIDSSGVNNLSDLLKALNTSLESIEQEQECNAINIMTMHRAKGLDAKAVFIMAAENEYIPGLSKGREELDALRLFYVSITRAENYLYITYCLKRTGIQLHTGANPDTSVRNLTKFLDGGPLKKESGIDFTKNIAKTIN